MAQGIILAGGHASRLKTNKVLLSDGHLTYLERAIEGMRPHVTGIIVVTGAYHDDIVETVRKDPDVIVVWNKDHDLGMFTSVQKGVAVSDDDLFILPGDCPYVTHATYEALLASKARIAVPSYQGRSGHPIFIAHELRDALLKEPVTSDLRRFRDRIGFKTVAVDDPMILLDIDTPADLDALKRAGKDDK